MKCSVCGAELTGSETICPGCGSPVENPSENVTEASEEMASVQEADKAEESISNKVQGLVDAVRDISAQTGEASGAFEAQPQAEKPKKKTGIIIGVAAAAVVAVGALAFGPGKIPKRWSLPHLRIYIPMIR